MIGISLGWTYGEEFEKAKIEGKIKVHESGTDQSNFQMLYRNHINVAISDRISAEITLNKLKLTAEIKPLNTPLSKEKVYIGYPKLLNQKARLEKFNIEIEKMQKDGTIDEIVEKYLKTP